MNRKGLGLPATSLVIFLSSCSLLPILDTSSAEQDEAETIVESGEVDVISFEVGDCLLDLDLTPEEQELFDAGKESEVSEGYGVPCSSTHTYEVYHVETNGIQSASQLSQAGSIADDICYANFETFAGISFDNTFLSLSSTYPTEESFAAGSQRITCLIHLDDRSMVTGSLKGKGPSYVREVAHGFRAGECLNGLDDSSLLDAAPQQVPCEDSHVWEVYFVGSLDDFLQPPVDLQAEEMCSVAFSEFIGVGWGSSPYTFSWYQPDEETYLFGDRKVACLVHTEDNTPVSGSLKGSGQ